MFVFCFVECNDLIFRYWIGTCKVCKQTVAWSSDRVASHKRGGKCNNASRREIEFFSGLVTKTTVVEITKAVPLGRTRSQTNSSSSLGKQKSGSTSSETKEVSSKTVMTSFKDQMNAKEQEILDQLFANAVFRLSLPFKVANAPALRNFIHRLRPSYKLSKSDQICTSLT